MGYGGCLSTYATGSTDEESEEVSEDEVVKKIKRTAEEHTNESPRDDSSDEFDLADTFQQCSDSSTNQLHAFRISAASRLLIRKQE